MKSFILSLLMVMGVSFGAQAHPMQCEYDHGDMKCKSACGKVVHEWRDHHPEHRMHHHHHMNHHHHHHMMHHHH